MSNQIKIKNDTIQSQISNIKKKYEYKTKWDLILKVKELRKQNYRIIDISQSLGISEKTVIEYNKIPFEDEEKYNQPSTQKSKSQISQKNKWELIQKVQEEYKRVGKYSLVSRKYNINERTVKKYLNIKEPPVNGNKNRTYASKLDLYKNEIIKMNNEGCSWIIINKAIRKKRYTGSDSLLRTYLAKIRREETEVIPIEQVVERTTMISLLYKEIENVKNIDKELFDKVIKMFPKAGKIYDLIKEFKNIMFSKKEYELDAWITKTKKIKYTRNQQFY